MSRLECAVGRRAYRLGIVVIGLVTFGCEGPGRGDDALVDSSVEVSPAESAVNTERVPLEGSALGAALLNPTARSWSEAAPDVFVARFETSKGSFDVEVHREWAPIGADRFYNLVRHTYFDDSRFFRVVGDFIAQFGIPGDPVVTAAWAGHTVTDDPVVASNERGTLTYAMTGRDTRHTQIYINLVDNVRLDSTGFAPFGRVRSGMEVVDVIFAGYGENAGGGMRRGDQERMLTEGNAHLDVDYPELDRIHRAYVVPPQL